MENPQVQNQQVTIPSLAFDETSSLLATETLQHPDGSDHLLLPPLKESSIGLGKMSEVMANNPNFNYNQVLEIVKNFKSINPNNSSLSESILVKRPNQISDNLGINREKASNEGNDKFDGGDDEEESEDNYDDDSENEDDQSSPDIAGRKNLIDNVKENLDYILQTDGGKKKLTEKRWWTPEEVTCFELL